MTKRVPVAEKLLTTKLFGFSVKRVAQAFGVPIAPGVTLLGVGGFPFFVTGPLIIVGVIVGMFVFIRTPAGQSPHEWLFASIQLLIDDTVYHWQPITEESEPVFYEDTLETSGETRALKATAPEENYVGDTIFGSKNTVDLVDFDLVHDDGLIETERRFSRIIEIKPRPWLILDDADRDNVYEAYRTVLQGLESTTQTLTLPVPFDTANHVEQVQEANIERSKTESPILYHARLEHAHFLESIAEDDRIKDRRHFMAVTTPKLGMGDDGGLLPGVLVSGDDGGLDQRTEEEKLTDEVETRAESLVASLPNTGVEANIVRDREEVLQIMYFYYKGGGQAPSDLSHTWLTNQTDEQTTIPDSIT